MYKVKDSNKIPVGYNPWLITIHWGCQWLSKLLLLSLPYFLPLDEQALIHSPFSTLCFRPWLTNTQMKMERDLEGQDCVSVWDGTIKKKRSGGSKRGRARYMQRERVELKVKEGEREIGCIFILWSVSIDGDKRSKHASPLSPRSVSMETLFLTLTHILCVQTYLHCRNRIQHMWFKWTSYEE